MTKNKPLKINKGWFYSAGYIYNWMVDGHDAKGVGIAIERLVEGTVDTVIVDGLKYKLDVTEARSFVKKYKSLRNINGKNICIVSKSILKHIEK